VFQNDARFKALTSYTLCFFDLKTADFKFIFCEVKNKIFDKGNAVERDDL